MAAPEIATPVHYVAVDTPGEAAGPRCAAAIVTAVHDEGPQLAVLHPSGYEFLQDPTPAGEGSCAAAGDEPGTWHALPAPVRARRKAAK